MNVFISWSGKTSGELAKVLRDWLPSVIQAVKPYFSTDDIEKGTRGNTMLAKELEEAGIGILCLTRENLEAPWIMFEAGALSKSLDKSRVCPILFGELSTTDLKGPLTHFQASEFSKEDMLKVLATINKQLGDAALETKILDNVFEKWWPELEQKVKGTLSRAPEDTVEKIREDRELLEEILTLVRQIPTQGTSHPFSESIKNMKPFPPMENIVDMAERMLDFTDKKVIYEILIRYLGIGSVLAAEILDMASMRSRSYLWSSTRPKVKREDIKSDIQNLKKTGSVKK